MSYWWSEKIQKDLRQSRGVPAQQAAQSKWWEQISGLKSPVASETHDPVVNLGDDASHLSKPTSKPVSVSSSAPSAVATHQQSKSPSSSMPVSFSKQAAPKSGELFPTEEEEFKADEEESSAVSAPSHTVDDYGSGPIQIEEKEKEKDNEPQEEDVDFNDFLAQSSNKEQEDIFHDVGQQEQSKDQESGQERIEETQQERREEGEEGEQEAREQQGKEAVDFDEFLGKPSDTQEKESRSLESHREDHEAHHHEKQPSESMGAEEPLATVEPVDSESVEQAAATDNLAASIDDFAASIGDVSKQGTEEAVLEESASNVYVGSIPVTDSVLGAAAAVLEAADALDEFDQFKREKEIELEKAEPAVDVDENVGSSSTVDDVVHHPLGEEKENKEDSENNEKENEQSALHTQPVQSTVEEGEKEKEEEERREKPSSEEQEDQGERKGSVVALPAMIAGDLVFFDDREAPGIVVAPVTHEPLDEEEEVEVEVEGPLKQRQQQQQQQPVQEEFVDDDDEKVEEEEELEEIVAQGSDSDGGGALVVPVQTDFDNVSAFKDELDEVEEVEEGVNKEEVAVEKEKEKEKEPEEAEKEKEREKEKDDKLGSTNPFQGQGEEEHVVMEPVRPRRYSGLVSSNIREGELEGAAFKIVSHVVTASVAAVGPSPSSTPSAPTSTPRIFIVCPGSVEKRVSLDHTKPLYQHLLQLGWIVASTGYAKEETLSVASCVRDIDNLRKRILLTCLKLTQEQFDERSGKVFLGGEGEGGGIVLAIAESAPRYIHGGFTLDALMLDGSAHKTQFRAHVPLINLAHPAFFGPLAHYAEECKNRAGAVYDGENEQGESGGFSSSVTVHPIVWPVLSTSTSSPSTASPSPSPSPSPSDSGDNELENPNNLPSANNPMGLPHLEPIHTHTRHHASNPLLSIDHQCMHAVLSLTQWVVAGWPPSQDPLHGTGNPLHVHSFSTHGVLVLPHGAPGHMGVVPTLHPALTTALSTATSGTKTPPSSTSPPLSPKEGGSSPLTKSPNVNLMPGGRRLSNGGSGGGRRGSGVLLTRSPIVSAAPAPVRPPNDDPFAEFNAAFDGAPKISDIDEVGRGGKGEGANGEEVSPFVKALHNRWKRLSDEKKPAGHSTNSSLASAGSEGKSKDDAEWDNVFTASQSQPQASGDHDVEASKSKPSAVSEEHVDAASHSPRRLSEDHHAEHGLHHDVDEPTDTAHHHNDDNSLFSPSVNDPHSRIVHVDSDGEPACEIDRKPVEIAALAAEENAKRIPADIDDSDIRHPTLGTQNSSPADFQLDSPAGVGKIYPSAFPGAFSPRPNDTVNDIDIEQVENKESLVEPQDSQVEKLSEQIAQEHELLEQPEISLDASQPEERNYQSAHKQDTSAAPETLHPSSIQLEQEESSERAHEPRGEDELNQEQTKQEYQEHQQQPQHTAENKFENVHQSNDFDPFPGREKEAQDDPLGGTVRYDTGADNEESKEVASNASPQSLTVENLQDTKKNDGEVIDGGVASKNLLFSPAPSATDARDGDVFEHSPTITAMTDSDQSRKQADQQRRGSGDYDQFNFSRDAQPLSTMSSKEPGDDQDNLSSRSVNYDSNDSNRYRDHDDGEPVSGTVSGKDSGSSCYGDSTAATHGSVSVENLSGDFGFTSTGGEESDRPDRPEYEFTSTGDEESDRPDRPELFDQDSSTEHLQHSKLSGRFQDQELPSELKENEDPSMTQQMEEAAQAAFVFTDFNHAKDQPMSEPPTAKDHLSEPSTAKDQWPEPIKSEDDQARKHTTDAQEIGNDDTFHREDLTSNNDDGRDRQIVVDSNTKELPPKEEADQTRHISQDIPHESQDIHAPQSNGDQSHQAKLHEEDIALVTHSAHHKSNDDVASAPDQQAGEKFNNLTDVSPSSSPVVEQQKPVESTSTRTLTVTTATSEPAPSPTKSASRVRGLMARFETFTKGK